MQLTIKYITVVIDGRQGAKKEKSLIQRFRGKGCEELGPVLDVSNAGKNNECWHNYIGGDVDEKKKQLIKEQHNIK